MNLVERIAPYLAVLLLVAGALFGAYHFGGSVADERWQARWNSRDAADLAAKELNESTERAKEQARQASINKVVENGQVLVDTANAAVTAANRESGRLRDVADGLADRLAASEARGNSCTAAAGKAAAHTARVLADVLKLADEAAGKLAATADQARARGVSCEAAYRALGN
ncbi:Protein of unknown function (DUF2514) [Pseudomonas asplenii]|uniref:DUF2514 domain-containing protein n=1 Tax=Pseudomonas asplenii TaxID=53407 RepID=A0A0M9GBU1_9PSED|nr:DUF2514 family protein [Pseudomonas fuscovaginae]KPA87269.1 Protein of unknown function (DUF2514) [Pseudomonas fuscovaginae]